MSDVTHIFCDVIRKQLLQRQVEVVQIVPLPPPSDRGQRMKVLQELMLELEENRSSGTSSMQSTMEYWVQLRPLQPSRPVVQPEPTSPKPSLDGIYLPNGKLNVPYLMKNAELLFEAGDYALARKIYKSVLQSGEYTGTVLYRLGRCFEAEGKFEEACAKYEESLVFHPILESYQKLAALLVRMNKTQQAAEVMERAQGIKDLASSQLEASNSGGHRPATAIPGMPPLPSLTSVPARSAGQKLRIHG